MAKFNDELSGIAPSNIIPEGCMNFTESAKYVIESIEEDLVELFEESAILNEDVAVDEAEEAEGGEKAKGKLVQFFENLWARIKEFFDKVVKWFKEQADKAKKAMQDAAAKIEQKFADAKKARGEKFAGKIEEVKGSIPADAKLGKINTFAGVGDSAYLKDVEAAARLIQNATDAEKVVTILNGLPGAVCGGTDSTTVKEMKKKLHEDFLGEEITVTGANFDKLLADKKMQFIVFEAGTNKQIKKAYNVERKLIKDAIAEIKGAKKENPEQKQLFSKQISALSKVIQTGHAAVGVECSAAQLRSRQYLMVMLRGYSAGKSAKAKAAREAKKAEKKAAKESADIFVW